MGPSPGKWLAALRADLTFLYRQSLKCDQVGQVGHGISTPLGNLASMDCGVVNLSSLVMPLTFVRLFSPFRELSGVVVSRLDLCRQLRFKLGLGLA